MHFVFTSSVTSSKHVDCRYVGHGSTGKVLQIISSFFFSTVTLSRYHFFGCPSNEINTVIEADLSYFARHD